MLPMLVLKNLLWHKWATRFPIVGAAGLNMAETFVWGGQRYGAEWIPTPWGSKLCHSVPLHCIRAHTALMPAYLWQLDKQHCQSGWPVLCQGNTSWQLLKGLVPLSPFSFMPLMSDGSWGQAASCLQHFLHHLMWTGPSPSTTTSSTSLLTKAGQQPIRA